MGFEYLQRRLQDFSGQPVPVLCDPQSKEVFLHFQMELSMCQFVPLVLLLGAVEMNLAIFT